MKKTVEELYPIIRQQVKDNYESPLWQFDDAYEHVDNVMKSKASSCQKALCLLLSQFIVSEPPYVVEPAHLVHVVNVYDFDETEYDYLIDLSVIGGHEDHPVKLAVLCDEMPVAIADKVIEYRRRDVNLQVAGWCTLRFHSLEITQELERVAEGKSTTPGFPEIIDWIMRRHMRLIDSQYWLNPELYKRLTGWELESKPPE